MPEAVTPNRSGRPGAGMDIFFIDVDSVGTNERRVVRNHLTPTASHREKHCSGGISASKIDMMERMERWRARLCCQFCITVSNTKGS